MTDDPFDRIDYLTIFEPEQADRWSPDSTHRPTSLVLFEDAEAHAVDDPDHGPAHGPKRSDALAPTVRRRPVPVPRDGQEGGAGSC